MALNPIAMRLAVAAALAASSLLQACVVYPRVLPPRQDGCQVVSREVDLAVFEANMSCNGANCLEGLLLVGAIGTASLLVSGGVALIGNTLHWMEVSARCPGASTPAAPPR